MVKHVCSKEKEITTLDVNQSNMSKYLSEMGADIKDILRQLSEQHKQYPSKEDHDAKVKEFDDFKVVINEKVNNFTSNFDKKIAYQSGVWAVVVVIVSFVANFIANKYL